MTIVQYRFCIAETANYTVREDFATKIATSPIWGDMEGADIPSERISQLCDLWDACGRSVKEIAALAGLSQRKLAERFCIPYRTVEDWCSGKRACALYLRLMMQQCLGLMDFP